MSKFVNMNWLKFIQRLVAISAIFIIWIGVYLYTMRAESPQSNGKIELPLGTLGLIKVNTPAISKSILFEFAFNNKDPRILKIVSEYWQNLAQDTSKKQIPIDFNHEINFIKVKDRNDIIWILSGEHMPVKEPLKPELGFIRKNRYYWVLNSSSDDLKGLKMSLNKTAWFPFYSDNLKTVQYHLISNKTLTNSYLLDILNRQLLISYKPTVEATSLRPSGKGQYFHLTTTLNKGSFIPPKYLSYKKFIESLSGLSINYYGAKYIDDDSGPSYVEPQCDILLTFAKKTSTDEMFPLLRELFGNDLRFTNQSLLLHNSRYHFHAYNDSTLYIGKNRMRIEKNFNTFAMNGNPEVITEISNLGWKAGVLELIPEYRALKEFSHSINSVKTTFGQENHTLAIQFKEGINPQLESFLLVLTLVNAYQF